jgi:hypothetical protein
MHNTNVEAFVAIYLSYLTELTQERSYNLIKKYLEDLKDLESIQMLIRIELEEIKMSFSTNTVTTLNLVIYCTGRHIFIFSRVPL